MKMSLLVDGRPDYKKRNGIVYTYKDISETRYDPFGKENKSQAYLSTTNTEELK